MFVTTSIGNGSGLVCYALESVTTLTCLLETPSPAGSNLTWGTAGIPKIYYGDPSHPSIVGKEVDARYYATALTQPELTILFTQRKLTCTLHCQTCSDWMTCSLCATGWYLSGGKCLRCNACCVDCTGFGNTACGTCAFSCFSPALNTCIRKH